MCLSRYPCMMVALRSLARPLLVEICGCKCSRRYQSTELHPSSNFSRTGSTASQKRQYPQILNNRNVVSPMQFLSPILAYLRRRASRSDSSRQRMSSTRTGQNFSNRGYVTQTANSISRTWAFDVPDNRTGCVVHELDANLRDTTTRTYFPPPWSANRREQQNTQKSVEISHTGSSENSGNLNELDGSL